jgi:hypothetical protein
MSRSANGPSKWVQVIGYIVAGQVSWGGPVALWLTEAMLQLLAPFVLAAYTSAPWLHNFLRFDRMLRWPTGASSYSSII